MKNAVYGAKASKNKKYKFANKGKSKTPAKPKTSGAKSTPFKGYTRVTLDINEITKGLTEFFNILDKNEVGIDEITVDMTLKSGKKVKFKLFDTIHKAANKLMKKGKK